jgi:thiol-disulfide isomerase/thioredoxin
MTQTSRPRASIKAARDVARAVINFVENAAATARQDTRPPRVEMAYIDLFPDGRLVANDSLGFRLDPSSLFPTLPQDARQARQGWNGTGLRDDSKEYRPATAPEAADGPGTWAFVEVDTSPMNRVYLMTSRSRYDFDRKRGLVRRIESENTQGYGFNGKGTGTTELIAVEIHDPERTRLLAEESDRYFSARKRYTDLVTEAGKGKEAGRADALLAQAETILKDVRETLRLPILKEQAGHDLEQHKAMASYHVEQARDHAAILGHAAADWETKDLAGKPHALEDYRGKVLILDFWYRGCGWCIRAMPQIKELAEEFKDEPVAVLGMNTDTDAKDAQFVVDELRLNYPVLKAEGLPAKYKVRGFPTLIIVDGEGRVADIHVGYSPTLRQDVSKAVRALLGRK